MNELTESVAIKLGDDQELELSLWSSQTVDIYVSDVDDRQAWLKLDLDEIRALHEALGHLLWVASR